MTEAEALAKSSGWVKTDDCVGYLPFFAANFLVRSGRWVFKQVTCWGYVVRRAATEETQP